MRLASRFGRKSTATDASRTCSASRAGPGEAHKRVESDLEAFEEGLKGAGAASRSEVGDVRGSTTEA